MNKTLSIAKKVSAVVLSAATLLSLCSCSGIGKKVKPAEFITMTYETYNGYGHASMGVDYDAINDIVNDKSLNKAAKKAVKEYYKRDADEIEELVLYQYKIEKNWTDEDFDFDDLFCFELAENYTNLSNGDKVTVNVELNYSVFSKLDYDVEDIIKAAGISMDSSYEFTVEGLKEAKTFDVLKDIEKYITYKGADGAGVPVIAFPDEYSYSENGVYFKKSGYYNNTLSVVYNNTNYGSLSFETEANKLTTGDVYTVKMSGSAISDLFVEGIVPKSTEKEITTPNLGHYANSASDLTQDQINAIASDLLQAAVNKGDSEVQLVNAYVGTIKADSAHKYTGKSCLVIIYSRASGWFTEPYSSYTAYNIIVKPDGTYSIGDMTYNSWGSGSAEDEYAKLSAIYNYTQVK